MIWTSSSYAARALVRVKSSRRDLRESSATDARRVIVPWSAPDPFNPTHEGGDLETCGSAKIKTGRFDFELNWCAGCHSL
jgi:hypothetical protein